MISVTIWRKTLARLDAGSGVVAVLAGASAFVAMGCAVILFLAIEAEGCDPTRHHFEPAAPAEPAPPPVTAAPAEKPKRGRPKKADAPGTATAVAEVEGETIATVQVGEPVTRTLGATCDMIDYPRLAAAVVDALARRLVGAS